MIGWEALEAPESLGCWVLSKNIHFNKVIVAKYLWNFVTKEILRKYILVGKYIAPDSVMDWVRRNEKRS